MRTATGLTLIALGAILGLAVNASTPGINLHIVGLIIALTGAAGLLLRSRSTGWLRRRVVLDGEAAGNAPHEHDDRPAPAYLVEDPAVLAAEVLSSAQLAEMAGRHGHGEAADSTSQGGPGQDRAGQGGTGGDAPGGQAAGNGAGARPGGNGEAGILRRQPEDEAAARRAAARDAAGHAPSADPGERG